MEHDLPSKCRINNIRWMRFGPNSAYYKWEEMTLRTDGYNNDSYNKSVVNHRSLSSGNVQY